MTESDCEIEYLEEDEEIVQKCVSDVLPPALEPPNQPIEKQPKSSPLLVERKPVTARGQAGKRRKPKHEDDEDYDPRRDDELWPKKLKRQSLSVPARSFPTPSTLMKPIPVRPYGTASPKLKASKENRPASPLLLFDQDHQPYILPDYEDPVHLPVHVGRRDKYSLKSISRWNNVCRAQKKKNHMSLKLMKKGQTSTTTTVMIRSVPNKLSGTAETTVWNRVVVQNESGEKRSDDRKDILPMFREEDSLEFKFRAGAPRSQKKKIEVASTLLNREDHKERHVLVVYKPDECTAVSYKLVGEHGNDRDPSQDEEHLPERYVEELTSCKICAPCYQYSWRGANTDSSEENKNILCVICNFTFTSTYNLLSHMRTHSETSIRKHRGALSRSLAKIVGYHYKCRICQQHCDSIMELRKHVRKHISGHWFRCEVGNHYTR